MELSAIVKVFRLMEELGSRESPAQLSALARASGIPKATAHRVLRQLCDIGYVEREDGGTYRLTSKIQQLSSPPVARQLLVAAESHLEELHRQLGETVNLAVLRDGGVVYLRILETTQSLRRVVEANCIDPFHCTALGRAIVSHLPQETIDGLVSRVPKLKKLTTETVVNPVRLLEILDDARRLGYAVERDETDIGVTCIGAPICPGGRVIGAVSVSAPSARLRGGLENKAIRAVKQTATAITMRLSGQNSGAPTD
jgi:DNA-binding IclR family transcriptional regulator